MAFEWLGQVGMALVNRAGGLRALAASVILLTALLMLLIYYYAWLSSGNSKASFVASVLMMPLISPFYTLRPQLLGYIFLAITLILLEHFRQGRRKPLWLLPALFVLWVNTHGSFVLGLVVLLSLIVIAGRRDLEPSSPDVYALLALTALALPLLAKSVWPYYYLDAYVFGAVWLLGQAEPLALRRRLVGITVPLVAVLGTFLTEYEMPSSAARTRLVEGVAMGLILSVLTVALVVRLRRPPIRVSVHVAGRPGR